MSEKVETAEDAGRVLAASYGCPCEDFHFVSCAPKRNEKDGYWFCFRRGDEGVSQELQNLYYVSERREVKKIPVTKRTDQQRAG